MSSHKIKLRSGTFMPAVLGASIAAAASLAAMQATAKQSTGLENPTALAKSDSGLIRVAACAAKKTCGACNPCKVAKGCNPCAAKGCNPCAAKSCNPCAPKKGCNPCAAKKN